LSRDPRCSILRLVPQPRSCSPEFALALDARPRHVHPRLSAELPVQPPPVSRVLLAKVHPHPKLETPVPPNQSKPAANYQLAELQELGGQAVQTTMPRFQSFHDVEMEAGTSSRSEQVARDLCLVRRWIDS